MGPTGLGTVGTLAVVPPAVLEAQLQRAAQARAQAATPAPQQQAYDTTQLSGFIRGQYEIMRNHRNSASGWNERLLHALRTFNGQYDAAKLAEIRKFGGSDIYARMIAQKCRGASSLLRDVYLGPDRPWALRPPASPDVPQHVLQQIDQLIQMEAQQTQMAAQQPPMPGAPPPPKPLTPEDLNDRKRKLVFAAEEVAKKRAQEQASAAEDRIEEILRNGNFYTALAEFIVDLPIFPFAVMKGPVVKVFPEVEWVPGGGQANVRQKPRLYWYRVSPFDFYFTPGVAAIEAASTIERLQISRAELNDMLDLPGYNTENIKAVLDLYGRGGLYDNWDTTDSERAVLESRENPAWNRSGLLHMMEFNGNVQGRMLQEYGLAVEDELRDYHVQVWCIGSYCIKAQLSPSPRVRHPYFVTSFEKMPGTPVGNGLTDILSDVGDAANATLRALINNMAMASGPQVVVNDDRLTADENGEDMYPWKRWHVRTDPVNTNVAQKPIEFFQPESRAQELLAVYKEFSNIADDISAIPKYVSGSGASGGAGRTASGLAMLMGNSSKILQTVSANVDRDVLEQALLQLFDLILLTDPTGVLSGQEKVTVQGVNVAIQRETQRQRQIEFLGATNNPVDMKIIGVKGRASILRSVSTTIGMNGEEIVPDEDKIEQMEQQEQENAQAAPIKEAVDKAVVDGVAAGTKAVATELTKIGLDPNQMVGSPPGAAMPPGPGRPIGPMDASRAQGARVPAPNQGPPQTNAVTNARPHGPAPGGV